ncbi:MAG: hypothetical protein ACLURG_05640, partial [Gemmiger sp.]
ASALPAELIPHAGRRQCRLLLTTVVIIAKLSWIVNRFSQKTFFNLPLILPANFSAFIKTEPYSIRSTAL